MPSLENIDAILNLEDNLELLVINQTKLESFPLFNYITRFNQLKILSNPFLEDISNLASMEFGYVEIFFNEALCDCAITSICQYLNDFNDYRIYDNKEGCNSREDVLSKCDGYVECGINSVDFVENFDTWETSDIGFPWMTQSDSLNLYNWTAYGLTKNDNSLNASTGCSVQLNSYGTDTAQLIGELVLDGSDFVTDGSTVDITFDYCFDSFNGDLLWGNGILMINQIPIWNTGLNTGMGYIDCSNPKTIELCDIPIPNNQLQSLSFLNESFSGSPFALSSSFILDNISISGLLLSSLEDEVPKELAKIYPNPVSNKLWIESSQDYSNVKLVSFQGNIMIECSFESELSFNHLSPGIYFLFLISDKKEEVHKVIVTR